MSKICKNCNTHYEDDNIKFCSSCGSSEFITEQPAEETLVEPTISAEPEAQAEPTPEQPIATEVPAANAEVFSKKASNIFKKLSPKKIALIAIPLVLVAAILLNISFIGGLLIKLFGSDKSYMHFVEKKAFKEYADSVATYYNDVLSEGIVEDQSYKLTVSPEITEDGSKIINKLSGEDIELDWLNNTQISATVNSYKGNMSEELLLKIDKKEILKGSIVLDVDNNEALIALGNLSKYVLMMDLDDAGMGELEEITSQKETIQKIMPSTSTVKKLITRYSDIVIENIDDVEKSTETKTIDGVSQKFTTITYTVDAETVLNIEEKVLEKLLKDKDIKKIIENAEKVLNESGLYGDDLDGTYDQFIESIEDELDRIDDRREYVDDDDAIEITDYVNNKHEIVGRSVALAEDEEDEEIFSYLTVKKGSKTATKIFISEGNITIEGSGKRSGNNVTGEYEVKAYDQKIGKIILDKFNVESIKKGKYKGTIRFEIDSDMIKYYLPYEVREFSSFIEPAIEFNFNNNPKSGKVNVSLYNDDEKLFGMNIEYSRSSGKKISAPKGEKLDVTDSDDMEEFVESIDTDKFINTLEKTSLPEEYIEAIEDALDTIS